MVLALIAATGDDQGAAFFAYMGVAAALVFANLGASYGTAKAGVGIASLGVIDSSKITKSLIPIIMAGIECLFFFLLSRSLILNLDNLVLFFSGKVRSMDFQES